MRELILIIIFALLVLIVIYDIPKAFSAEEEQGTPEWMLYESLYQDWDHLWFSWFGYKNPKPDDVLDSWYGEWWGKEVEVNGKVFDSTQK